jgi:hypothetical protein
MRVTVRQYYEQFVSLWGLAAGAPFVPPLLHVFIPDSSAIAAYIYPPLGDVEGIAVAATIGILLVSTFVIFTCCESPQKIHPIVPKILMAGIVVGMCILIVLFVKYVRRIEVPAAKLEVPVSVGYQRSDLAVKNYPQAGDWEMLHLTGVGEDQIQSLWTPHSIWVVRVLLWFFYTMTVTCFLSVVSIIVYRHAAEEAQSKSKSGVPENAP